MSNQRVGVIQGGAFPGREQSLHAGQRVAEALRQRGHEVVTLEAAAGPELVARLGGEPLDVAFVTLPHGHERQTVLSALELHGIPHTGSAPLANGLSCDRLKSKELFRLHNLPTLPHYLVSAPELGALKEAHGSFGYPVQVSPRGARADLGPAPARTFSELSTALHAVIDAGEQAVVERSVEGTEIQAALLDGRMLGALQLQAGVWQAPELSAIRLLGILHLAERAARVLECRGAVSVSLLVTQGGNEYIQEVDAAPSLALGSLLPELSSRAGFSFGDLCDSMLQSALRQRRSSRPSVAPKSEPRALTAPTRWSPDRNSVTPTPQRVAV